MDTSAQKHLGAGIQALLQNRIAWSDVGTGGILTITAEDARYGEQRDVRIQVVAWTTDDAESLPVCAILSPNFHFHDPSGKLADSIPAGTLCIGGYGATLLPQPRLSMINLGGPDVGRDLLLENIGDTEQSVVVHAVSGLSVEPPPSEFTPPCGVTAYTQHLAQSQQEPTEADLAAEQTGFEEQLLQVLTQTGQELPDWLMPALATCHRYGAATIASLLDRANHSGQFAEALGLVRRGFEEQWGYQIPEMRAHPAMGSNSVYLSRLYTELGISSSNGLGPADSSATTHPVALALRQLLTSKLPQSWQQPQSIQLESVPTGTQILMEMSSGNRHALVVDDPAQGIVSLAMLRIPEGLPIDGFMSGIRSSDLRVGKKQRTDLFVSSRIDTLYLALPAT